MNIDLLHGEIWYQFAYTIALLEKGNKLSEEDIKALSDKIHEIIVSRVGLPVGMPSETLSCELNGIKKGLGAIDSEARRQRRLAETFKVNDDSWKFHTTKAHYYEDVLRVIETNKNFYIKNLASKP